MSDNPADSLRRELIEAAREALEGRRCICGRNHVNSDLVDAQHIVTAIWPLVEAARADERERINQPRDRALRAARELASLTAEEWRVLEAFEPTKVNELRALLAHRPARGGV